MLDGLESSACELADDVSEGDPAGDRFTDDRVAQGAVAGFEVLDLGLYGEELRE